MRLLPGFWLLRVTMAAIALLLLVKTATLIQVAVASVPSAQAASALPGRNPPPAQPTAAGPAASASPLPSGGACPPAPSVAEMALLGNLKARNAALDRRQSAVAAREVALAAAERQFSARMTELTALQKRIDAETAARKQAASKDTMRLVRLYEAMKPADAAAIFNQLDRNVLLQVLDAMNVRRAAAIMAAMQPQRARLVTAELAAMRARRDALPTLAATPPPGNASPPGG